MKRSHRFSRPHVHTVASLESLEERWLLSTSLLPASFPFGLPALVGVPVLNAAPAGPVGVGTTVNPASGTNPLSAASIGATVAGQGASLQTGDSNTVQLAAGLTLNSAVTGPVGATATVDVAPGSNDLEGVPAGATVAGQGAGLHVGASSGSTGSAVGPIAVTVTRGQGTTANVSGQVFGIKVAVSGSIAGGLTRIPGTGNPPVQVAPPVGPSPSRGGFPVLPVGTQAGVPPVAIPGGAGTTDTSASTGPANVAQFQPPHSLLPPVVTNDEARSPASALTATADSVVALTPPDTATNASKVPNEPAEAGPENGDMLTGAPVDLLGVKYAMQQLTQQLRGLGKGFADMLLRLGVSPWVFFALGVAAAAAEVARRNLRRFHARAAGNAVLTSGTAEQP